MVTLEKLKQYLRIDIDAEDSLLESFLVTAENFLKGAVTDYEKNYSASEIFADKADFLIMTIAAEYYQNRDMSEGKYSYAVKSMLAQLQYYTGG